MHGDITGVNSELPIYSCKLTHLQANVLIDKRGHARLIDFGLSTIIQPLLGQSHLAVSSWRPGAIRYAAPELVLPEDAHEPPVPLEKADIWSFGCIMLQVRLTEQVLSGRLPWSETRQEAFIIVEMSHGRGPQRLECHPAIIDLDWDFIQKCLLFKPESRPSAEEVLDFVIHRFSTPGNAAYFVVLCCSSTYTSFKTLVIDRPTILRMMRRMIFLELLRPAVLVTRI
ncbi:kinase-like domain-containing protein [Suillus clintonianus]|uniref:kinase-like domain-containing protein n=1 Tax=Suillus clintonianus TaxID=1904413 RepID=UPI001B86A651|nr:kinase-like domain-containing protein [Suillus clintonianus]KAG2122942.1 kinase-like domain-containing protein [Suillus clintonianus]